MDTTTLIFGSIAVAGVAYMMLSLFVGDLDIGGVLEGLEIDFDGETDGFGISCGAIAAFCAAFGVVGWGATVSGSSLAISTLAAVVVGYAMGRMVNSGMRFFKGQEHTTIQDESHLLGRQARITISIPGGKIGEAMIEAGELLKYPVKEVNGADLKRNDMAEVVSVEQGFLLVKKHET